MSDPIKIVAFGDSLTAGAQSPTPENPNGQSTPYGEFLQKMLGDEAVVIVRGRSGELTGEMVTRLSRDVLLERPDYVVVLGGTNDLGWGAPIRDIIQNLSTIYNQIKGDRAIPVGVTIPSIQGFDQLIPPRQELNRWIIETCRTHDQPFIDLFAATADPKTLRLAHPYSSDGLHLTTEGYRLIAELLYKEIFGSVVNR